MGRLQIALAVLGLAAGPATSQAPAPAPIPAQAPSQAAPPAMPAWLTGVWAQESPSGQWVEEWWTTPRGRMMLGASKTGKGDAVRFYEHLRIEVRADGLAYCALPKGQNSTCFQAVSVTGSEIAFENPTHDYPRRIAYRRDGDRLFAEISGPDGSRPQRWQFRRVN